MLVLFALLIGPVNFILVKKLGRPSLLLVSVPAIALITSLGLVAYGVLSQGLDVKVVTRSFTLLDQRLHRASTVELRNLFAGGSPGPGMRPAEGSTCFVNGMHDWRDELLAIDQSDGTLLGADYLPVRRPVSHALLSDGAARGRLEVAVDGGELTITNGLGARVETLLLRAADGGYLRLLQPLEDGARARLAPFSPPTDAEFFSAVKAIRAALLGEAEDALPPGTYLARLEASPFTDDCGLELVTRSGEHHVLGVLEREVEAWR
jgi:hypothetical protein